MKIYLLFLTEPGVTKWNRDSKQKGVLFHMVYIEFVELIGKGCYRSQNYKQVQK